MKYCKKTEIIKGQTEERIDFNACMYIKFKRKNKRK